MIMKNFKAIFWVVFSFITANASYGYAKDNLYACLRKDAGEINRDPKTKVELVGEFGGELKILFTKDILDAESKDLVESEMYPTEQHEWQRFAKGYNDHQFPAPKKSEEPRMIDDTESITFDYWPKWWDAKRLYLKIENQPMLRVPVKAKDLKIDEDVLIFLDTGTGGGYLYKCYRKS
jgi:hypothetical protein